MAERPEVVCGVVGDFVAQHVDDRLSMAWQLAYVASQTDKWSLKNEVKWRSVEPVGKVIELCKVLGMKTLRQDDDVHSPPLLEANHPEIAVVVDISREHPPYDPKTFRRVTYHKFPTVSKIPPSRAEVRRFIDLIDKIRENSAPDTAIAVHCHYGFNRTGFFICCYLIERANASVKDAIAAFKESRPPGIKHDHFIDELYVRYSL
jgi:protein tyrosine phosphatase